MQSCGEFSRSWSSCVTLSPNHTYIIYFELIDIHIKIEIKFVRFIYRNSMHTNLISFFSFPFCFRYFLTTSHTYLVAVHSNESLIVRGWKDLQVPENASRRHSNRNVNGDRAPIVKWDVLFSSSYILNAGGESVRSVRYKKNRIL